MRHARWLGVGVLCFLALHSVVYGAGFVLDRAAGAREFGAHDSPSAAAETLTGLVGVVLLVVGLASLALAAALWRQKPGAPVVAAGLGLGCMAVGAYWAAVGFAWDAGFYSVIGLLLVAVGVAGRGAPAP